MSVRFHRPTERSVCVLASAYRPAQVDEFPSHLSDQVVFGHEGAVQPLIKLYQLSVHLSHLKTHIDKLASNSRSNRLFKKKLVLGSCREAGCRMWHFLKACEYKLAWFWLSGVEVFSRWALTARYSESHTCPATRQLSLRISDTDMEAGSSLLFRTCIHLFMEIICQGIFGLAVFCLTDASCHFLTCLSWLQGRTWPEKQAWMSQQQQNE